jgi:hypothetical protein
MRTEQFVRTACSLGRRLGGRGLAATALAAAGALAVGGGAAAGTHRTGSVPAGTITTVAGGVGGPAKATSLSMRPCRATFADGKLYIADLGGLALSGGSGVTATAAGGLLIADATTGFGWCPADVVAAIRGRLGAEPCRGGFRAQRLVCAAPARPCRAGWYRRVRPGL